MILATGIPEGELAKFVRAQAPSDKNVQDKARHAIPHVAGERRESVAADFPQTRLIEGSCIRSFSTVEFRDSPDCDVFSVCLGLI
jgi:hypothetical protein